MHGAGWLCPHAWPTACCSVVKRRACGCRPFSACTAFCRVGLDNVIASDVKSSRELLEAGPFAYCDVQVGAVVCAGGWGSTQQGRGEAGGRDAGVSAEQGLTRQAASANEPFIAFPQPSRTTLTRLLLPGCPLLPPLLPPRSTLSPRYLTSPHAPAAAASTRLLLPGPRQHGACGAGGRRHAHCAPRLPTIRCAWLGCRVPAWGARCTLGGVRGPDMGGPWIKPAGSLGKRLCGRLCPSLQARTCMLARPCSPRAAFTHPPAHALPVCCFPNLCSNR